MVFTPGDHVHVAAFGKGIVRDVRNRGRYLVEVKGRVMVVAASALTPAAVGRRGPARAAGAPAHDVTASVGRAAPPHSIDLHGKTVEEAIATLDAFLNDAILGGLADVQVIHGRSGGRVKAAVHARLKQISAVRAFRLDPGNPGVTLVRL